MKVKIGADLAKYRKDGTMYLYRRLAGKVKEVEMVSEVKKVKGYYIKYRNKSIFVPKSLATVVEE